MAQLHFICILHGVMFSVRTAVEFYPEADPETNQIVAYNASIKFISSSSPVSPDNILFTCHLGVVCHVAVQKAMTFVLVALLLSLIYYHKSYEK